jgi:hypothetical protein
LDDLPKGLIVGTIKKSNSFAFGHIGLGCTYASYKTSSFPLLLFSSFLFLKLGINKKTSAICRGSKCYILKI